MLTHGAVMSEDGLHRYVLMRKAEPKQRLFKRIAWFGVNPSIADDIIDDPTVRKWRGFTNKLGGECFLVGNLFSHRSTDVRELRYVQDHRVATNDAVLRMIVDASDLLIPCWGSVAKLPLALRPRADQIMERLVASGKPVACLGRTKDGSPRHPLMLAYTTTLEFIT